MKPRNQRSMLWTLLWTMVCGVTATGASFHSGHYDSGFQNTGGIPDGSLDGWSDTRTVTGTGIHHVSAVRVTLAITGGYNGDLYAYLVHGNGFAVLLNRVGLASTNAFAYPDAGLDVTLDTAGAQNVHFYAAHSPVLDGGGRLTGIWQPDARGIDPLSADAAFDTLGAGTTAGLGALAGLDPLGEWTLFVADVSAGGGAGTVQSWGLEIETVVEPAAHLVITSVNGGTAATAGSPFAVVVEARDVNGVAAAVAADTAVSLGLTTGTGILAGTLTGTITAGTSSLTFTNVTCSRAESGVVLTATRTSGDALAAGASGVFDVNPGALARLQILLPGETAAPGSVSGKTGSPTAQTVGTAVSVTVRAVDANWNLITNVTDTVGITSSDAGATLPGVAALSGGARTYSVTFATAGSRTVTATDASQPSITAATSSAVVVQPGDQVIAFTSPGDQTYQLAGIGLTATASSGLSVTFVVTGGPATVSGNSLVLTGAGSVTVEARQAGNADWNAAPPVSRTISVAAKSVTPSITASGKTYDGSDAATIATRSLAGVINGDDVSLAGGSAVFDTAAVGSGKTVTATGLSLGGTAAGSYVLSTTTAATTASISEATVTITSGIAAVSKVYDGTRTASLSSNAVVLAGIVSGDTALVALSTNGYSATFDTATVGTGKTVTVVGLTLTGGASGNYALTQPSLSADIQAGTVSRLVFATQPGGASAGAAFARQPVLRSQDAFGNDSTAGLPASLVVTLALDSGTGPLLGTRSLDIGTGAGNGVVTFTNLRLDARGTKALRATASGLADAVSSAFTVANVAPTAGDLATSRARNVSLKLRVADLLSQATDLNGDSLALVAISATSTNGAVLRTNATYVLYGLPPGGNVPDSFAYTVSDGLLTATATVRVEIQPDPAGQTANLVAFGVDGDGHPTMAFAGVPGYVYRVQRTQDLTGTPVWVDLATATAPVGGLFRYTDTSPPAGNAYYRAVNE